MPSVSIIVPTLNEEKSILPLVKRIHTALSPKKITYQIIFVDDHSTDKTRSTIRSLKTKYPISLYLKKGERGKTQSLFEGFGYAKYPLLCMIDADLQYPPEVIPEMITKIKKGADIIVTNRTIAHTSFLRKFVSRSFLYLFAKLLHGFDFDVQSGLKLFKKECLIGLTASLSPWTFDMELLRKNVDLGYTVEAVDILFEKRLYGKEKINVLKASWQIGSHAVRLRFSDSYRMISPGTGQ